ncbi:unnamed protein product [Mytilus edulis]|uniref:C1q domain-containing protein n=1 Tax=Mytilus edulis TaxID=6550 RepID=A0A8S3VG17_MYTED|nr:unnamed protein product [Mytilus edulis]
MGNLQAYTKSLEQQLQSMNNTQSSYHQFIVSENKKLKQDIVTLFQMELNSSKEITKTHTKITNMTTVLDKKIQTTRLELKQNWNSTKKFLNTVLSNEFKTNDRVLALESNISKTYANVVQKLRAWSDRKLIRKSQTTQLRNKTELNSTKKFLNVVLSNEFKTNDRILALESNISKTYTNVVQKLGAWSDRALFSAWPDTTTIHAGGEIPFTNIQVSNGIKDLSSIRNHGSFVCEKDGYYLVSCFIRTDTSSAKFRIERNNDIIAAGSKHGDTGFESHAAIAAVHLDVGDVLHVTAGNTMVVDSKFDSVFTVVQIM